MLDKSTIIIRDSEFSTLCLFGYESLDDEFIVKMTFMVILIFVLLIQHDTHSFMILNTNI